MNQCVMWMHELGIDASATVVAKYAAEAPAVEGSLFCWRGIEEGFQSLVQGRLSTSARSSDRDVGPWRLSASKQGTHINTNSTMHD